MNHKFAPYIRIEIDGSLVHEDSTLAVAKAIVARDRAEQAYLRVLSRAFDGYDPFGN
jgi:hypothetical protein